MLILDRDRGKVSLAVAALRRVHQDAVGDLGVRDSELERELEAEGTEFVIMRGRNDEAADRSTHTLRTCFGLGSAMNECPPLACRNSGRVILVRRSQRSPPQPKGQEHTKPPPVGTSTQLPPLHAPGGRKRRDDAAACTNRGNVAAPARSQQQEEQLSN